MRIAFDARPLLGLRTGVSVWLEGLLRALAASTPWRFLLCLPRRQRRLGVDDLAPRVELVAPALPMLGTLWLNTLAAPLLNRRAEVYLGTLGILPRRLELPSILVVHDLTPLTRPHHHTIANRFCFNAYFASSLDRAELLVCDSEATRSVLAAYFPGHGRRARVVPLAADDFFSPAGEGGGGESAARRFAGGRRYLLQLGTLEPRKGIATLIEAHARLFSRGGEVPDLVLAGGRGWGGNWLQLALARHPFPERVHLPGYVAREDVRNLLRHAELVVLAAEEEGFGLPLAEAFACGAACVASDAPALVELSRGAARHFSRGDAPALAALLGDLLAGDERGRLRAAALTRAQDLGWAAPLAAWRELITETVSQYQRTRTAHSTPSLNTES
jgi:glycosyltransferase involved in cell wall biosynthesis